MNLQEQTYAADIVLCIDATGSMSPIIDKVKESAINFYKQFEAGMAEATKQIEELRVKVITFRDYKDDAEPMKESEFFVLPEQNDAFESYVRGIEATGGGDLPENALEAICYALNSDWTKKGSKRRYIIAVFSDAAFLQLGERSGCPGYPTDLPKDLAALSAIWAGTSQEGPSSFVPKYGRLALYVPEDGGWSQLVNWPRTIPKFTGGKGCEDVEMTEVIDMMVGSFDN